MFWHIFVVLAVALLCVLPAHLDALIARSTGCHHNGTWYADKSLVPTMEKCLNCQCNRKTLVCRLKVCPEMPMPPPRGCVVVQKKNTCCPYLSCARLDAFYNIPTARRIIAYLDHYERESIDRVVKENVLQQRSDDSEVDLFVCVKNGTVYKSGSAMSSSNLCTYCYCIAGNEKCVKPKCMMPVEGCKPIFVDSTCCPVRYDCTTKTSGKSSQEVRYRKTSNKHFLRTSQRIQRNRGCTLNGQYYAEGQKVKSDPDKPCDICFCIRGTRRCAPKKCSPALKNCMPVVPKGQCCPSSYDCGSQRDYRRAQNSRQFNLYSLLFGNGEGVEQETSTEIPVLYPLDRHPSVTAPTSTTERSIFDSIREGLEFIDGNNNQMLADNLDLIALQRKPAKDIIEPSTAVKNEPSSTTEISFLDLLLSPNEPSQTKPTAVNGNDPEEKSTTIPNTGLSWVDLLLGPDEEDGGSVFDTTTSDKLSDDEATTLGNYDGIDIERVGAGSDEFMGSSEMTGWVHEMPVDSEYDTTTVSVIDYEFAATSTVRQVAATATTTSTTTIRPRTTSSTTTTQPIRKVSTSTPTNRTTTRRPTEKVQQIDTQAAMGLIKDQTTEKPTTHPTLMGALLGEIGHKAHNVTSVQIDKTNSPIAATIIVDSKPIALPTPKPLPLFKPLPSIKPHIRINSKIANLTLNEAFLKSETSTVKPQPNIPVQMLGKVTQRPITTRTTPPTARTTRRTKKPSTFSNGTAKPFITSTTTVRAVVIKTNPSILEAEPLDDNADPTLPPSLPNLKIIPFLPTDAVKSDRNKPLYDYYNSNQQTAKNDYDLYDDGNMYPIPSITESYPTYGDLEDGSKAEYIYKFNVEGPAPALGVGVDKMDVPVAPAGFLKYDFTSGDLQSNGFSPPTKTEGGFVPKDPLIIDETKENNGHVTKHIIDITTSEPIRENTTKLIEITTPDPFKDVIHTEPPPDLSSLIEDKEKIINSSRRVQMNQEPTKNEVKKYLEIEATNKSNTTSNNRTTEMGLDAKQNNDFGSMTNTTYAPKVTVREEPAGELNSTYADAVPPFKTIPAAAIKLLTTKLPSTTPIPVPSPTPPTTTSTPAAAPTKLPIKSPYTKTTATTSRVKSAAKPTAARRTHTNATKTATTRKTKPKPNQATRRLTTTTTKRTTTTVKTSSIATRPSTAPTTKSSTRASSTRRPATVPPLNSTTTTVNPFLMSPFDKLPYMNASFEVKRHSATPTRRIATDLLGLVHYKNSINQFEGLEPAYQSAQYLTTTAAAPTDHDTKSSPSSSSSGVGGVAPATGPVSHIQHAPSNSLIDPAGILKLAGCNIYGRMYRVGRIILELSSACVECKCTEVGVKCGPLDC